MNSIVYFITTPVHIMKYNSSETTRSAFTRGNIKDSPIKENLQWLVGVTDGDGTFYFARTPKGV